MGHYNEYLLIRSLDRDIVSFRRQLFNSCEYSSALATSATSTSVPRDAEPVNSLDAAQKTNFSGSIHVNPLQIDFGTTHKLCRFDASVLWTVCEIKFPHLLEDEVSSSVCTYDCVIN